MTRSHEHRGCILLQKYGLFFICQLRLLFYPEAPIIYHSEIEEQFVKGHLLM